jgi:hypothetical protein
MESANVCSEVVKFVVVLVVCVPLSTVVSLWVLKKLKLWGKEPVQLLNEKMVEDTWEYIKYLEQANKSWQDKYSLLTELYNKREER